MLRKPSRRATKHPSVVHPSVWNLRLGVCFVAGRNYHFFQTCLSGRKCSTTRQSGYSWSEHAVNPSLGARRRRPCRRRFCPGIPALARRRASRGKNRLSRWVSIRTVNFDAVHLRPCPQVGSLRYTVVSLAGRVDGESASTGAGTSLSPTLGATPPVERQLPPRFPTSV